MSRESGIQFHWYLPQFLHEWIHLPKQTHRTDIFQGHNKKIPAIDGTSHEKPFSEEGNAWFYEILLIMLDTRGMTTVF